MCLIHNFTGISVHRRRTNLNLFFLIVTYVTQLEPRNPEISASDYDCQAFDPISVSDFHRSVSIVGASGITFKFNEDSDTDKYF
ncbi:hypothetical protein TNCV_2998571 [Trichonephila clavipes]|nr:hypothetical protein TNCV_2998571 [Trichonephila clavipes]